MNDKATSTSQPKSAFLVERTGGGSTKQFYTREEDEQIVKLLSQGKSVPEIAKTVGHPAASVTYRITQKLTVMRSFNEYDYDKHRIRLTADEIKARKAESLSKVSATAQTSSSTPASQ